MSHWGNIADNYNMRQRILIVMVAVFAVSAAYAFYFRIPPAVDARTYDTVAQNLLNGSGFKFNAALSYEEDDAITYQGPAYQFFLAGIYAIFGHSYAAVWIIQSLLRALTAFLLFLACRRIFSERGAEIGLWAAIIFGFSPDLVEMNAMLMTETLFIFLSALSLWLFYRWNDTLSVRNAALLAIGFGAAVLTRSSIGAFLLVFGWSFYKYRAWRQAIVFCIVFAAVLTPWAARNYDVYHKFLPTMANFGYNLWVGNHEGGDGEGGNMPELGQAIKTYGSINANHYAVAKFKEFVGAHPLQYAELVAGRMLKYFSFTRPMGFWFYQQGIGQFIFVVSSVIAAFILFTLSFGGLMIAWREKMERKLLPAAIFIVLTCLSIVMILIETRYRLPVYPFLAIFAGFFADRLVIRFREHQQYLARALALAASIGAVDMLLEYEKILRKLHAMLG